MADTNHPTKDSIKKWLKSTGRSRAWLGEQCGNVTERAVNNWLSSKRLIPDRVLEIIKGLMEEDQQNRPYTVPVTGERPSLVLRPTEAEFDLWTSAFKHSTAPTLQVWALDGLNTLAKEWKDEQAKKRSAELKVHVADSSAPYNPPNGTEGN